MAPRVRRPGERISYAESSSEEDDTSASEEHEDDQTSSVSHVVTRKRARRLASHPPIASESSSQPRSEKRQKIRSFSYKEDSTDNESSDEVVDSDHEATTSRPPRPRRNPNSQLRSPPKPHRHNGLFMRVATSHKSKKTEFSLLYTPFPRKHGSPYWDTLPFHILQAIMDFASYPLNDPESMMRDRFNSAPWLAHTAMVCKLWYAPTIAVLYHSPPFHTAGAIHTLANFLKTPLSERPSSRILGHQLNQNHRIKKLEIDVSDVLAYGAHLVGKFDLGEIIPLLPQLDTIILANKFETPVGRQTQHRVKWNYPDSLFTALSQHVRHLKSFQWNQTMLAKHQSLAWLATAHSSESFQNLEELKLSGFEIKPRRKQNSQSQDLTGSQELGNEELLAQALQILPNIKKLEFESCSVVNEILLPLLPQHLTALVVKDCHFFDSPMLSSFLESHGSQLRHLELSHNKALEISFLTSLKADCPKVEVLRMDLNNHNNSRIYEDSKPFYDRILEDDEVPTWPSTLQTIELLFLRHWSDTAAISFFDSLVKSAEDLPDLRVLRLKAILAGLGWRQRTSFREEWISRLQRVFLRKDGPPSPHFKTLAGARGLPAKGSAKGKGKEPQNAVDKLDISSDSDAPLVTRAGLKGSPGSGQGRALRPRRAAATYSAESDEGGQPAPVGSTLADAVKNILEKHVQGMCNIVDVTIDNLRPAERQFNEADFLDDEPEDDEEWNGLEEGEYFNSWAS